MSTSPVISGNLPKIPPLSQTVPGFLLNTLRKNLYPAIFLILLIAVLYEVSHYNFALFHTAIEFSTIAIAVAIFLLVWKSRHLVENNYLLFVGVTFVFIAILDFLHTTVYQGVGIFPDGGGTLSTRLWIAARYMQAVTLFAAPLLMRKKTRIDLIAVVYLAADIIIVASIFVFKNFPVTYIEGVGLTPFKIFSEYIISLLLIGAVVLLYRNRASFDRQVLDNLVIAIIFMIISELAFTEYASFVDIFSIIGHVFRLVAYYFFYRAIIEVGQEKPYNLLYRDLNESEKKYRALSDLSPDAILVIQNGIIRYANNAGLHLSGVPDMEHLIGRELGDFVHPDDRTQAASRLAVAQDEQLIAPLRELRMLVHGVTIPVEATGGPFLWEGKPATQFVIRDISSRKNAEKALAQLDRDRKIILDNMPVMILYKDTGNNFIRVNAAVAKNTGHTVEEFEGKNASLIFPDEADLYYQDDLLVIRSGVPRYGIIEQLAAPNGQKIWVQTDKIPLKDDAGTVNGVLVISIDITERKRSEEALRLSEEQARARSEELATVMDSVPAAIWIARDPEAIHITGNAHSYEWLHIPQGSESSKSAPEGMRPETFRMFKNGKELQPEEMPVQLSARGIVLRNFEFDFVYPDGTIRNVLGNASPLRDPEGNVKGSVSSFIDITDRKRAEDELVNRLEDLNAAYEEGTSTQEELSMTVEQLTSREAQLNDALMEKEVLLSEVHHRVKNNLTAFISLLSLDGSMEETPSGKALKTDLQNRARSMALIHETLYRTGNFSTVDMDFYLTNLVGQIAKSYAERTDISIEIDAKNITLDLPRATAAGLIINELITNSFKYAFPRNFNGREERGADCVIRISLTSDNETYELKVADNGLGLPPGIDVPTTKSLGLKRVNFLARHQLRAETGIRTEKGTEFTFRIKKTEDFA